MLFNLYTTCTYDGECDTYFHTFILSHFHIFTLSYSHTFILSHFHTLTLSHVHTVILSNFHSFTQAICNSHITKLHDGECENFCGSPYCEQTCVEGEVRKNLFKDFLLKCFFFSFKALFLFRFARLQNISVFKVPAALLIDVLKVVHSFLFFCFCCL